MKWKNISITLYSHTGFSQRDQNQETHQRTRERRRRRFTPVSFSVFRSTIYNKFINQERSNIVSMLEKSCSSSATTSSNTTNHSNHHNYNNYLKPSHKISKPIIRRTPPLPDNHLLQQQQNQELQTENQQQNQPPVYNINKSDFRQVVQKLTGSPAHDRSTAQPPPPPPPPSLPPTHCPKPQSSRLQRIRPPPLAHLQSGASPDSFGNSGRSMPMQIAPFSPLPPLPTVHAAAESPISAYMKYIRSSNLMLQQPQQVGFPSPNSAMGSSQFALPNSPLAFGKIPSPRSPYPLLLSPRSAQFGFPQFQY